MMDTLRLFLSSQLKRSKLTQKNSGFTLIELLVAMILATLVITPLLGFMVNILDSDRKEQAKATSEQEIQSALDFIAQDLEQAVYIYDADGLKNSSTDNPPGIKDQIPPVAPASGCGNTIPNCVPVLVFWKREPRQDVLPNGDDTFVYSLVAYYLIQGNNSNGTWSDVARIGRFQIRDGVKNPITPFNTDGSTKYIDDPIKGSQDPSQGFQIFDLTQPGFTIKEKMNLWQKKKNEKYTDQTLILVDFVDKSTTGTVNCSGSLFATTSAPGFYACVDSSKTLAQVYIRGNSLARISKDPKDAICNSQSVYCPTASIQIRGRGLLGNN